MAAIRDKSIICISDSSSVKLHKSLDDYDSAAPRSWKRVSVSLDRNWYPRFQHVEYEDTGACSSSWTRAAAVLKPTASPSFQAARPRPMCVLLVPLLPTAMMFSRPVTYSERA